jgi:hypothetical protein
MEKRIPLTLEEKKNLERFAAKYEKRIKRWSGGLRYIVTFACLLFILFHIYHIYGHYIEIRDEEPLVEHLKNTEQDFEGLPPEIWAVAEVRRAATMFDYRSKANAFASMCTALSMVEISFALCMLVILILRWNDAKHELVLAKILRHVAQEWTEMTAA